MVSIAGFLTGIILIMARWIKDGTLRGENDIAEFASKASSETLIIPAKELVQVIAKFRDVAVTKDGLARELQHEKQQEIMTDPAIAQSHHVKMERVGTLGS